MNKAVLFPVLLFAAMSSPAKATGGLLCRTADAQPLEVSLGFGHVPAAGLFRAELRDGDRKIVVDATQWWMQGNELRLAMRHKSTFEMAAVVIANWNEKARAYDGSIWRNGRKRWVRCREA